MTAQPDYFANHERARQFPWTLYHQPLERDLDGFLHRVAEEHPEGNVLVIGCGLLHEIDTAPPGLHYTVADIDPRAVEAVMSRGDARIVAGKVVPAEEPLDEHVSGPKEVIEHIHAWPTWLTGIRRVLVPGGRLWLSTPNYGEPWLPALESTVLEVVARRSGFSRRHIHPTRFSKRSLARGLDAAGFRDVHTQVTTTRLAITAWAQAPH
jgi:SAM-dependent methyltransferase